MKLNFKAISIGVTAIIIGVLLLQLIYLLVSVAYSMLVKHYGLDIDLSESQNRILAYLIWGLGYWLVMYAGGAITAAYADAFRWQNSLLVGILSNLLIMMMLPEEVSYNFMALFFFLASVTVCFYAGYRSGLGADSRV